MCSGQVAGRCSESVTERSMILPGSTSIKMIEVVPRTRSGLGEQAFGESVHAELMGCLGGFDPVGFAVGGRLGPSVAQGGDVLEGAQVVGRFDQRGAQGGAVLADRVLEHPLE